MTFRSLYEQVNWKPSRRDLRLFGVAVALALGVLGTVLSLHAHAVGRPSAIAWSVAMGLLLAAALVPAGLLWPYRLWFAVTVPIGAAVQTGLLILFYYVILTPVGCLLRGLGRDPLRRRRDPSRQSYWEPRTEDTDLRRYFRPY